MNSRSFLASFHGLITAGVLFAASSHAHAVYIFTPLDTPSGSFSSASAINSSGQIVGWQTISGGCDESGCFDIPHATLWDGPIVSSPGPSNERFSQANAINNAGQIVGTYGVPDVNPSHAFLRNGATAMDLGTLGGNDSRASGINNSRQIVGASDNGNFNSHATLWNGTASTDLGTLGGSSSEAKAINNSGQIVGASDNSKFNSHATLWNGDIMTDLGTLGGSSSGAAAINDSGQIVGWSIVDDHIGDRHATFWNGTDPIDLGTLGGSSSEANGINASGQIVGWSDTAGGNTSHATLWNGTDATDLNSFLDSKTIAAGWVLNAANGINDRGLIVGSASNTLLGIDSQAFLLSPVPEPEVYAMLICGLGLLGFLSLRRKVIRLI